MLSKQKWCLTSTETLSLITDGEKVGGRIEGGGGGVCVCGGGGGKREIIYLSLDCQCHHQNDYCIKTGSNESHSLMFH